ncbi:hypothetical protein EDB19DRAFT_1901777 [Suillus lakei]|nr:hypothetical protein EDB19DRAFT_1901777 [Suillus lakei]
MAVNDHTLFTQLDLSGKVNPKDESLRRLLGCPPDEIQVQGLGNARFIARPRFSNAFVLHRIWVQNLSLGAVYGTGREAACRLQSFRAQLASTSGLCISDRGPQKVA